MAFAASQLTLMGQGNGFKHYRYDTLDVVTDVDTNGYFNNSDDVVNLAIGDIIMVVVWTTAIRTGTISTYGTHIVNANVAGVIDVSTTTAGIVTDLD